ncbi:MAG: MBL fold metallo-hydrolase [Fimbriimonadales bacterium]
MRIQLLGTGGADGIPAYCASGLVSDYAREHGGKDVRTRAAALVDGELKIDFGPDTLAQIQRDGIDASDWSAAVFTHSDEDHLAVSELQYFLYPFNENDHLPFAIYGNAEICRIIRQRYPDWPMEIHETKAFESFRHAGFTITPILANHTIKEEAHNLIVERDGRKLIYATDTGVWCHQTFDFVKGAQANALVIECTDAFKKSTYNGHLDIAECVGMVHRLHELDGLTQDARVVTTHHSHQGGARHCDLVKALGRFAIEPGYDGMEFDV